jgi:ribosomal protein L35
MKTRKSIKKRFKITKNGKVIRRPIGQDHYRGKKSGKRIRKTRGTKTVPAALAKVIKKSLTR